MSQLSISTLDALEEYLNEYQYLVDSFNKAYLLVTRYKLNYGQEGIELLLHDMLRNETGETGEEGEIVSETGDVSETTIRQRKPVDTTAATTANISSAAPSVPSTHCILTKHDHINTLKTTFHSLLHHKIVPLAHFKLKLEKDLKSK